MDSFRKESASEARQHLLSPDPVQDESAQSVPERRRRSDHDTSRNAVDDVELGMIGSGRNGGQDLPGPVDDWRKLPESDGERQGQRRRRRGKEVTSRVGQCLWRWCCGERRTVLTGIGGIVVMVVIGFLAFGAVFYFLHHALSAMGIDMDGTGTNTGSKTIESVIANWGKPGHFGEGLEDWPTIFTHDITPIPCHSHNDYWREVPLFSALSVGCTSVEADVWLVDGELYVGHERAALTKQRTLTSLYIGPLVQILENQNPHTEFTGPDSAPRALNGVFDTDALQSLTLLIDVKTDGRSTWPTVISQLAPLREKGYLTFYNGTDVHPGPITVVASGEAPFEAIAEASPPRDYFFDAPLDRLGSRSSLGGYDYSTTNSYYASVSFKQTIGMVVLPLGSSTSPSSTATAAGSRNETDKDKGEDDDDDEEEEEKETERGEEKSILNTSQLQILRSQIKAAHALGLKVRYWDLPAWPVALRNAVWRALVHEGVDVLNVDALLDVRDFLL